MTRLDRKVLVHRSVGQWINYVLWCSIKGHFWTRGERYMSGYFPYCDDCGEPYNTYSDIPSGYCHCQKCTAEFRRELLNESKLNPGGDTQ